jgi:hypothetical protein
MEIKVIRGIIKETDTETVGSRGDFRGHTTFDGGGKRASCLRLIFKAITPL